MLKQNYTGRSSLMWHSFEHPCNTLQPDFDRLPLRYSLLIWPLTFLHGNAEVNRAWLHIKPVERCDAFVNTTGYGSYACDSANKGKGILLVK